MSRADKRQHRDYVIGTAQDTAVRLYAFANTRPGYQVTFSPEAPVIVLKTKKGSADQHPCSQWAQLASIIFSQRPNTTHAVYVLDTTALPEQMVKEENSTHVVGPALKRLSNVVSKLNPHNAIMVAAGVSALFALKYIIIGEKRYGHTDRLVHRLILVCPGPIQLFQRFLQAIGKKAPSDDYPKPELVLLLSDAAQAVEWREWLQESASSATKPTLSSFLNLWSISTNLKPSLFAAVAREAGSDADETLVNLETHFDFPRLFRIDFFLSKDTKQTEQRVTISSLDTTGCDDKGACDMSETQDYDEDVDGNEDDEKASTKSHGSSFSQEYHECKAVSTVFGLSNLQHCKHPTRVILEGRIVNIDTGVVGSTEGRVKVINLQCLAGVDTSGAAGPSKLKNGMAIRLESNIERDDRGLTRLKALNLTRLTKMQEKRSMTVCSMAEVPMYNVSDIVYAYGALLIRGRKCVLVRSLTGEFDGMRLPFLLHTDATESAVDCAIRAVCEQCDISSDNFYIPNYLSPVSYYDRNSDEGVSRCVTIYIALAINSASGCAEDAVEDDEMPGEPYDWFGYAKAARLLQTDAERETLQQLSRLLNKAYNAGLYVPLKGYGLFGDEVVSANSSSVGATHSVSLAGMEIMVVCTPGDFTGRSLQLVREHVTDRVISFTETTSREDVWRFAIDALQAGANNIVICLSSEVDVNDFSEEELTYWWGWDARPLLITLLLPGISEAIVEQRDKIAAAAFVYSVMLSDTLVVVDCDMRHFTAPTLGLLRLAERLNSDLALYSGIADRQQINIPSLMAMTAGNNNFDKNIHEITVRRRGRPIIASRLAPLLESGALSDCCRHAAVLWAQGDVWLESRPDARGVLTFDSGSCCFFFNKGDLWGTHEDAESRQNVLMFYIWGTSEACTKLESILGDMMDGMLSGSASPKTLDAVSDDGLPSWD